MFGRQFRQMEIIKNGEPVTGTTGTGSNKGMIMIYKKDINNHNITGKMLEKALLSEVRPPLPRKMHRHTSHIIDK